MINHISCSSLLLFLHHRSAWHNKYVLGIRDRKTNPAALTGVAFHKWAELIHKQQAEDIAKEAAQRVITGTYDVEWGKTGSAEKCLKDLDSLIEAYNETLKDLGETQHVELGVHAKVRGIKLPIKGFIDLVIKKEDGIHLIDWKTVRTFEEELKAVHYIQAMFYKWSYQAQFKVEPKTMTYWMIKVSKNKDGSPRMKPLVVDFSETKDIEKAVKKLTNDSIKEMNKKRQILLPNVRDEYEGEKEWQRYLNMIINDYDRQQLNIPKT